MVIARVCAFAIGYFFGMWVAGYFIAKAKDVDIRTKGSGNVGTTNTMRILGIRVGAFTLLWDCLKCILAVFIVWLIFRGRYPEQVSLLMLYGAFGVIIGHDFPFYIRFKGGKGIASSLGMLVAIYPQFLPICVGIFLIIVATTRFVSLGSILAAVALIVQVYVFGALGYLPFASENLLEAQIITTVIGLLAILLHHSNIKRLLAGNENKLSFRSRRD